jgi:hypothetical protein
VQGNVRRRGTQRHEGREHRLVERVAVGRGFRRRPRREAAAGARAVDHQDLLAPDLAQPIGDDPQRHVRRAAGGRIQDDLHRLAGVGAGLRAGRAGGRQRQRARQQR